MSRRARRRAESWALKRGHDQPGPDDPDGEDDGEGDTPDLDAEAWAWAASSARGVDAKQEERHADTGRT